MEFIQLLTAAGSPAVVAVGAVYFLMKKDLKEVRRDVAELKEEARHCKEERCRSEAVLHGRVTDTQTNLANLKGRVNGHNEARGAA